MLRQLKNILGNVSSQPRKQRKSRYNAPLHLRQNYMSVHLSPELRKKHGFRSVKIRSGDRVRLLRGQFKKSENVVEKVDLKKERVFVKGVEIVKQDNSKVSYPIHPSNLMVVSLDLSDKKRVAKLNSKNKKKEQESIKNEKSS